MPARLLRVALTGGIGTGKSYCLARFAALGAPVVSADALAREAVAAGTPALDAVRRRFGTAVLAPGGALDRDALARVVFSDPVARRDLEAIVHPVVYDRIRTWYDELRSRPGDPIVGVADIPLLYETGHEADFDLVVVAACSPATQLARVMARDGVEEADAQARIAAQWPIDTKRAHADYVIDTGGTFDETDRQVAAIWNTLQERRAQ